MEKARSILLEQGGHHLFLDNHSNRDSKDLFNFETWEDTVGVIWKLKQWQIQILIEGSVLSSSELRGPEQGWKCSSDTLLTSGRGLWIIWHKQGLTGQSDKNKGHGSIQ